MSRIPIVPFLNKNGMKTSRVKGGKEKLHERQAAKVEPILVHSHAVRLDIDLLCTAKVFLGMLEGFCKHRILGCLNIALDQMKRLSAPLPHHLC